MVLTAAVSCGSFHSRVAISSVMKNLSSTKAVRKAFQSIDTDNDKWISHQQLHKWVEQENCQGDGTRLAHQDVR